MPLWTPRCGLASPKSPKASNAARSSDSSRARTVVRQDPHMTARENRARRDLPPSVLAVINQATIDKIQRQWDQTDAMLCTTNPRPDDLRIWLGESLRHERIEICKKLELHHRELLLEFDSRFQLRTNRHNIETTGGFAPGSESHSQDATPAGEAVDVRSLQAELAKTQQNLEASILREEALKNAKRMGETKEKKDTSVLHSQKPGFDRNLGVVAEVADHADGISPTALQEATPQEFNATSPSGLTERSPSIMAVVPVMPTISHAKSKPSDKVFARIFPAWMLVKPKKFPAADEDYTETPNSFLRRFERFVLGPFFESFFAFCIIANTAMMGCQLQYTGMDSGYAIGFRGMIMTAEETWPGASDAFQGMELVFGCLFTLELFTKIVVLRHKFILYLWNWFDSMIVSFWLFDRLVATGFNPMNLRLFRIARLIRIVKLIRFMGTVLLPLNLMLTSLKAGVAVGIWAILILFILQMAAAMFLTQILQGYIEDETMPEDKRLEVYVLFGNFTRSVVSMFMVTLANWAPACRLLFENVSQLYGIFFVLYKLSVGFAVLNVINGVFLHETFKVAQHDDEIMISSRAQANAVYVDKLRSVFDEADESGDGHITWEEFAEVLKQPKVRQYMSALDLDVTDVEMLFGVLDDGDGKMSFEEFLEGAKRTRGTAKSLDMIKVMHEVHKIVDVVARMEVHFGLASQTRMSIRGSTRLSRLSRSRSRSLDASITCGEPSRADVRERSQETMEVEHSL